MPESSARYIYIDGEPVRVIDPDTIHSSEDEQWSQDFVRAGAHDTD